MSSHTRSEADTTQVSTELKISEFNTASDEVIFGSTTRIQCTHQMIDNEQAPMPMDISQLKKSLLSGASFSSKNKNKNRNNKHGCMKIAAMNNNNNDKVEVTYQETQHTKSVKSDEHSGGSTSLTPPCLADIDIIDLLSDDDHDDDEDTLYDSDSGSQGDDEVLSISLLAGSIEKMFHMTTSDDDNSFQPMLQVIHVIEVAVQAASTSTSKRWKVSSLFCFHLQDTHRIKFSISYNYILLIDCPV